MSPLASDYLFGALAIHAPDDPWIAPGAHLHLHLSADLDRPLHPFVAWPFRNAHQRELIPLDVSWIDARGQPLPPGPFHTADTGPVVGTVLGAFGEPREGRWCYLNLEGEDGLIVEWLARSTLPWGTPVLGTRTQKPYAFGGNNLSRLRVSGIGQVDGLFGIHEDDMFQDDLGDPIVMGLPIEGSSLYTSAPGNSPFDEARLRLSAGQTRRLGPPDMPDGNFVQLEEGEDEARVLTLAPGQIDPWLAACFLGENPPPTEGQLHVPFRAALDAWNIVLTMAADPRIARYLGMATVVEPQDVPDGLPLAWLVAGHFPVSGRVRRMYTRAGHSFVPNGASAWVDSFTNSALHQLFPGADDVRARFSPEVIRAQEWEFLTLFTLAIAASKAPPDPPPPPELRLARTGAWNANSSIPTWTQSIALPGQPPSGSVGFARTAPGNSVSLHQQVEGFGAIPLLVNWSRQKAERSARLDPNIQIAAGGIVWTPPMITDGKVPENTQGATWRIWESDKFGRWSKPSEISAPLPERPVPPAPAPELLFTPQSSSGAGPASPGTITVRIDLPTPGSLPPGGRQIAAVDISVDGISIGRMPVTTGQERVNVELAAASLLPGQSKTVEVTASFRDTDDSPSMDGKARLEVFDPRPVLPNPTAPNLLWAGRLDATGKAELAITWPAPDPAVGYRVYLGDERRLAVALSISQEVLFGTDQQPPHRLHHTRTLAADKICEAARVKLLRDKAQFTLLTERPLKPVGGNVRFQFQLPGGLRGACFLRIVPVTPAGAEPPFESCGLIPIAVPLDDHPSAPTVQVTKAPEGVRVRILTYGLTPESLARFGFPGSGSPLEYRVRRTRGQVADHLYLPIIRKGTLTPPAPGSAPDAPWTAEFIEPEFALPAFVTHTWLADVRYPPEPARAEVIEDPGTMAIRPLWDTAGFSMQSRWSPVSLPASMTMIPAGAPATLAQVRAQKHPDGTIKLTINNLPAPHPKTIAPYQIAIWKWVSDGDGTHLIDEPDIVPIPPRSQMHSIIETVGNVVAYSVALIDPLGRLSAPAHSDVVTTPPILGVPNVVGVNLDEAFQILRDNGLVPLLVGDPPLHPETAFVHRLDPQAGEPVQEGSQILVTARDEGVVDGPEE